MGGKGFSVKRHSYSYLLTDERQKVRKVSGWGVCIPTGRPSNKVKVSFWNVLLLFRASGKDIQVNEVVFRVSFLGLA